MTFPTPHVYRLVWLDDVTAPDEAFVARMREAGVDIQPVSSLPDLPGRVAGARALVVHLEGDVQRMRDVRDLVRGSGADLPMLCRVRRSNIELGLVAMREGAAHVMAADDFSRETWGPVLEKLHRLDGKRDFVFVDPASRVLLDLVQRVAAAGVTTLITGPTGVGKEVVASLLHGASPRRHGPFVALNCAALPESMVEDLLFGHERGAFTGALREHRGVFEQAHGGTLFLDEIGEMPQVLQTKLLRVLQERQVTRIGAQSSINVDVRLVAATNSDLRQAIAARQFREDLYFRLSTFRLRVPSLAERRLDILPLARHMLDQHAADRRGWKFSEQAQALLLQYDWPGNVRELSNVIQRALVLSQGTVIDAEHLVFEDFGDVSDAPALAVPARPHDAFHSGQGLAAVSGQYVATSEQAGARLRTAIRNSEHRAIADALHKAGSRLEAAKVLGISPRTLRYKLAQLRSHGLSPFTEKQA